MRKKNKAPFGACGQLCWSQIGAFGRVVFESWGRRHYFGNDIRQFSVLAYASVPSFFEAIIYRAIGDICKTNRRLQESGLTDLTILDLASNSLSDIAALEGMTNMTRLDLSSNALEDISSIANLSLLRSLYLNNNRISNIDSLSGLESLVVLDLSNNDVEQIDALMSIDTLVSLYLENNPLDCQGQDANILALIERSLDLRTDCYPWGD
jgi:hypothetical protein